MIQERGERGFHPHEVSGPSLFDSAENVEYLEEIEKHNSALAKEVDASFQAARANLGAWTKISDQAYVQQRNRVLGV